MLSQNYAHTILCFLPALQVILTKVLTPWLNSALGVVSSFGWWRMSIHRLGHMGHFPQDRGKWAKCSFFLKKIKLYCDQTLSQLFWKDYVPWSLNILLFLVLEFLLLLKISPTSFSLSWGKWPIWFTTSVCTLSAHTYKDNFQKMTTNMSSSAVRFCWLGWALTFRANTPGNPWYTFKNLVVVNHETIWKAVRVRWLAWLGVTFSGDNPYVFDMNYVSQVTNSVQ